MTLYFDMQTRQLLLLVPPGAEGRERQTVTIATLFEMIEDQENKAWPKWKRYYYRHRQQEAARLKRYRATRREQIREYNRQYKRNMRQRQKMAQPGQEVIIQEAKTGSF